MRSVPWNTFWGPPEPLFDTTARDVLTQPNHKPAGVNSMRTFWLGIGVAVAGIALLGGVVGATLLIHSGTQGQTPPVGVAPTATPAPTNTPVTPATATDIPIATQPTSTDTPAVGNCPTAAQAAQSVGYDPSLVKNNGELCGFQLVGDGKARTVHCPTGLGKATLEVALAAGGVVIIQCDGFTPNSYHILAATLRFQNWEPDGDACTLHTHTPNEMVIGATCP